MVAREYIERAIRLAGSQANLARLIGVTQQTISNWKDGAVIRAEFCSAIERETEGAITRRDLRPSDWQEIWPELAVQPNVAASGSHPEAEDDAQPETGGDVGKGD